MFWVDCSPINFLTGKVRYIYFEIVAQRFNFLDIPQIDVYSFGLLLCEMCIRELPVPRQTEDQISLIKDEVLRNLVTSCAQQDPEERPKMTEVIGKLEQMEHTSDI